MIVNHNGEVTYLFNPFQIKKWTDEQMIEQVNLLVQKYNPNDDTMYQLATSVDILSDLLYLYGEMIARLTEKYELKKIENDAVENKKIYDERSNYKVVEKEKAPAMSYFESLAYESVKEDRKVEAELKADLTRFKKAYESLESKMNAIKKKMDAVKFETIGG